MKIIMNSCKLIQRINLKPHLRYRSLSGLCNSGALNNCVFSVPINYHSQQKTNYAPNIINKRNFSVEGFVQWQGQVYASISNSYLVHTMQDGLLHFHDATGLPWWSTIVCSTVLLRALMTLPLTVFSNRILAKVENISLELKDLVEELKKETAMAKRIYKLTDKQAIVLYKRSLKKQWQNLIVRDNCHPFKASLVIWVQIPIWVCMSFALRNLVYCQSGDPAAVVTLMELTAGGIGWFPNLAEPDHSYIMPVVFGLSNLAVIEIQRMSKLRQPSKVYNIFTNVFRVFSIVMIPVAASVPSCMCLYWLTSSSFGLIQNLCLLSPSLRRKLRIPEAPSELEQPYSHMKEETPIIASIYTSGRDERYFTKANMFLPYRWDRNDPRRKDLANHNPSATLPFALGARSCIGKKMAMMQLTELLSQVVQNFEFRCTNIEKVLPVTSQVLVPNEPVQLTISHRNI